METFNIYQDIAERTGGDIYIGVVGPVRTGKSTFIKRFMDLLVLPHIANTYTRERAKDELPQSASGRTIMTTEPKFVPNEAVEISLGDNADVRVRMIDCVGYLVPGAEGDMDGDSPRMVHTPWAENAMPFREAAELGTKKVITDHSTIGMVVTTDGSVTELPRENYEEAEERVVAELQELGKPFLILLNTAAPYSRQHREPAERVGEKIRRACVGGQCGAAEGGGHSEDFGADAVSVPIARAALLFPRMGGNAGAGTLAEAGLDGCAEGRDGAGGEACGCGAGNRDAWGNGFSEKGIYRPNFAGRGRGGDCA